MPQTSQDTYVTCGDLIFARKDGQTNKSNVCQMTSAGEDITQSGGRSNVSSGRGGRGKESFDFKNIYIHLFIWLQWVLVVARGIFHCGEVAQAHELISCSVQA